MSETVTAVQPDKAAMEKINLYTRRAYKPEEVYTFSVVLCDNEVDRDGECFTKETLELRVSHRIPSQSPCPDDG